ncbi:hypothetical protein Tco_1154103 [Tanacetum coccineum]
MKMEILLEPTSNKLMVVTHWFTLIVLSALRRSDNENMLSTLNTTAGNPVKKILLKLNLSDHRSILTDLKVTLTNPGRMTKPYSSPRSIANCFMQLKYMFQDFRYSDTAHLSRSDEVLKLKNFKKNATLKLFKNDAQDHYVKYKFKEQAKTKKSMITTTYSQEKVKSTS